jgi:hypothetical protein
MFLGSLHSTLGDDVARAHELDERARAQVRQIFARDAAATDDADANPLVAHYASGDLILLGRRHAAEGQGSARSDGLLQKLSTINGSHGITPRSFGQSRQKSAAGALAPGFEPLRIQLSLRRASRAK